jgi:hypothetical protein
MQVPSSARGVCAIMIGFNFGGGRVVVLAIALVCSASIIAASAQFSASVAEFSVVRLFTIQTYVGFVPMLVSIHIMPHAMQAVGWRYAFAILCVGPFLGTVAMLMLRWMPEAVRLASGRR